MAHQYSLASSPWLPSSLVRPNSRSLRTGSLPFHSASAEVDEAEPVADPAEPVLAPAVRPGVRLVERERRPGVAVGRVVLPDRAPLPAGQVRPPEPPRAVRRGRFGQPGMLGGRPLRHRLHRGGLCRGRVVAGRGGHLVARGGSLVRHRPSLPPGSFPPRYQLGPVSNLDAPVSCVTTSTPRVVPGPTGRSCDHDRRPDGHRPDESGRGTDADGGAFERIAAGSGGAAPVLRRPGPRVPRQDVHPGPVAAAQAHRPARQPDLRRLPARRTRSADAGAAAAAPARLPAGLRRLRRAIRIHPRRGRRELRGGGAAAGGAASVRPVLALVRLRASAARPGRTGDAGRHRGRGPRLGRRLSVSIGAGCTRPDCPQAGQWR